MKKFRDSLGFGNKQSGQALPEYGLTLALITLFCLAALSTLGNTIFNFLTDTANFIMGSVVGGG